MAAVANEEVHPHAALQRLDLLRQRGTGDAQPLGGPAEVKLLGNRHEIAQLAQFHGARIRPVEGNSYQ